MMNDGNTDHPINQNAKKIESELTGAPNNKGKKKRNEIHNEIISALLRNEALTESEIGDACGYREKGSDKCPNVHRQIKKLVLKWNYIEKVPETLEYRIKRDLATIGLIYNDKTFSPSRPEFSESTWFIQFLMSERMPEFREDDEFIGDIKKIVGTSSSMVNFFLRGNINLTANLGAFLGPAIPTIKTPGLNPDILASFTRKCNFYDLFVDCMCLDHGTSMTSEDLSVDSLKVLNEIKGKSARDKIKAINYIQSFTTMQNLARCIDATKGNDGQVPSIFDDILKDYNTIIERTKPDKTKQESPEKTVRDWEELYNKFSKLLRGSSPINTASGQIPGIGSASKTVIKNRTRGSEKN